MPDTDSYGFGADDLGKLVPAMFAKSVEEADRYRLLLEDHDIPAQMDEECEPALPVKRARPGGVAVLVPESLLEDAREVIAAAEDMADLVEDDEEDDEDDDEEEGVYYSAEDDKEDLEDELDDEEDDLDYDEDEEYDEDDEDDEEEDDDGWDDEDLEEEEEDE